MSGRQPQYQPGQIIPGTVYRVHRVIGAGGMGTVYDVEDTTVGKRYVLKTLHANLADRDDLANRLLREARALARMHHLRATFLAEVVRWTPPSLPHRPGCT